MAFDWFNFLMGGDAQEKQLQTLTPQQQQLFQMLQSGLMGQEGSGPFGGAISNLASLASGDPQAMEQFTAPMQRQFEEQTIPDLGARFSGMGSGGAFQGSGFRNAAAREGSNLAERMQALTGQMQMQAAGMLPGFFQQASQPQFQPAMTQPTEGLIPGMATGFAQGLGKGLGGSVTGGF